MFLGQNNQTLRHMLVFLIFDPRRTMATTHLERPSDRKQNSLHQFSPFVSVRNGLKLSNERKLVSWEGMEGGNQFICPPQCSQSPGQMTVNQPGRHVSKRVMKVTRLRMLRKGIQLLPHDPFVVGEELDAHCSSLIDFRRAHLFISSLSLITQNKRGHWKVGEGSHAISQLGKMFTQ